MAAASPSGTTRAPLRCDPDARSTTRPPAGPDGSEHDWEQDPRQGERHADQSMRRRAGRWRAGEPLTARPEALVGTSCASADRRLWAWASGRASWAAAAGSAASAPGSRSRGTRPAPAPATKPATRTPSSLTGRGGAYSSSRRSASAVTRSVSSVAVSTRVRAGHRREVVEADLDRDRPAPAPVTRRGSRTAPRPSARAPRGAARERRCPGRRSAPGTPRRPCAARPRRRRIRTSPGAAARAPAAARSCAVKQALGRLGQRRQGRQPEGVEARGGLRADPRDQAGRRAGEALAGLFAGQRHQPGRLLGVGGDLGDELVRADAHRAGEPRGRLDLGHQPAHRGARREQPLEVEVGLVEADDLDALDVLADDRHDPRRGLAVEGEVGRQEDGLGTQPPGTRGGHRRADPVAAGLVAGGRDHRPRARAGRRPPGCPRSSGWRSSSTDT